MIKVGPMGGTKADRRARPWEDILKLVFHGARGSIPVPGPDTMRFGGNTTCLELALDDGPPLIVDAGTGARALGRRLAAQPEGEAVLLLTHLHWDHIMGFPFFGPIYLPGWRLRLGGWPRALAGLRALFGSSGGLGHFPVEFDALPARIQQDQALTPPRLRVGELELRTTPLNHPQGALGLRFEAPGGAVLFFSDNELDAGAAVSPEALARFGHGARVLIHDAQYEPEEMAARRGWGHSDWLSVVALARQIGVERLILTHHDPDRTDDQVEAMLEKARLAAGRALWVDAAHEGMTLAL